MRYLHPIIILILFLSCPANAESTFFFEVPGERENVGSWSVVIQEGAGLMVMLGESRLRKYPNTLETSAPDSGLQVMCNAGVISLNALLPEGELLLSGAYEDNFGHYLLWVDGELVGQQQVAQSEIALEGDNLIVPILAMRQENESLNRFLDAETISVRAAPMSLTTGMITATYLPSQTREAFSHISSSCGWN